VLASRPVEGGPGAAARLSRPPRRGQFFSFRFPESVLRGRGRAGGRGGELAPRPAASPRYGADPSSTGPRYRSSGRTPGHTARRLGGRHCGLRGRAGGRRSHGGLRAHFAPGCPRGSSRDPARGLERHCWGDCRAGCHSNAARLWCSGLGDRGSPWACDRRVLLRGGTRGDRAIGWRASVHGFAMHEIDGSRGLRRPSGVD